MLFTMALPGKVWELIFEYVLYAGGRQSVLSLLRVCKIWKASFWLLESPYMH
jgi:hypothetical protein